MAEKITQTAGRNQLGDFAPMFAHGVTKEEIAAIITHATMYTGWPKGWAVFRLAKEAWKEN